MKIALFPCKVNPPHIGHIITLLNLLKDYDKIIIDILDCDILISTNESISILKKVLDHFPGKFEYTTHKKSYVIENDFSTLPEFDEVVTGNRKIYDNLKKNNFKVRYIRRTQGFRGKYIREAYLKFKDED